MDEIASKYYVCIYQAVRKDMIHVLNIVVCFMIWYMVICYMIRLTLFLSERCSRNRFVIGSIAIFDE